VDKVEEEALIAKVVRGNARYNISEDCAVVCTLPPLLTNGGIRIRNYTCLEGTAETGIYLCCGGEARADLFAGVVQNFHLIENGASQNMAV
jgi:hypothetical protein